MFWNDSKRKSMIFLGMALLCGLAAATIVLAAGARVSPSVSVLAIAGDLAAGDPISPDRVKMVKLPPAGLPPDFLLPDADLTSAIAAHGLSAGDVLRAAHVVNLDAGNASILAARLRVLNDEQLRVAEVPTEAGAGMLAGMKTGDRVDIISVTEPETLDRKEPPNRKAPSDQSVPARLNPLPGVETIIEAAPVIGVQAPGEKSGVLLVAVTPGQAELLAAARHRGKVYVTLRPFGK